MTRCARCGGSGWTAEAHSSAFWLVAIAVCAFVGCDHASATAPSTGYAGEWSGTTSQNQPIAFTVSTDQRVVSISISYDFSGCSGTETFANLSLTIAKLDPPGTPPYDNPGFGYAGQPGDGSGTVLLGAFTSNQTATGMVTFVSFPNCKASGAMWNATKHR